MSSQQEYYCYECLKKYPEFNKYQTHVKMKHNDSKQTHKPNMHQQQIADIEDKIYAFMGQLSDNYSEVVRASQSQNLLEQNRITGQANYLPNSIIRTPYQTEIDIVDLLPNQIKFHPQKQMTITVQQIRIFKTNIKEEVTNLSAKLKQERLFWQFADPLDQNIDFNNQFSIFDVCRLLKNYSSRNIVLKYPQVSVFIVWLGRICKPQMFKIIYQLFVSYALIYQNYEKINIGQKNNKLKNWQKFTQQHNDLKISEINQYLQQNSQLTKVKGLFGFQMRDKKIDSKRLQKLVSLYDSWVILVLAILNDQQKSNLQQPVVSKSKITHI